MWYLICLVSMLFLQSWSRFFFIIAPTMWNNKHTLCWKEFYFFPEFYFSLSCKCCWCQWSFILQGFEAVIRQERHWGKVNAKTWHPFISSTPSPKYIYKHYMIVSLCEQCQQLVLVNPIGEVMEKLQRGDEAQDLARPDSLFLTVAEAVASLSSTMKCQTSNYVWWWESLLRLS